MRNCKGEKFKQFYLKYIIKNPILFYMFLAGGVGLFLFLTLSIETDGVTLLEQIFKEAGNG